MTKMGALQRFFVWCIDNPGVAITWVVVAILVWMVSKLIREKTP
jgi:hypothetical protein